MVSPNHPFLAGFSIIFTIHFGGITTIFGNTQAHIYIYTYIPKGSLGRTWLIFLDMFRYRSGFFLAFFNSKAGFRLNHPVKV